MKHLLILVTYKLKSGMRDAFLKTMSESGIWKKYWRKTYRPATTTIWMNLILTSSFWLRNGSLLNIRKSTWKHRIWQDSSLSKRNTFLKPSLRNRRFKLNFSKLIAYFLKAVYTVNSRWAICLSCGLTHKIRLSFRTSGAGQLTGNGKTSVSYRTSGADQLTDNGKISH